jgi:hypothetical protein
MAISTICSSDTGGTIRRLYRRQSRRGSSLAGQQAKLEDGHSVAVILRPAADPQGAHGRSGTVQGERKAAGAASRCRIGSAFVELCCGELGRPGAIPS